MKLYTVSATTDINIIHFQCYWFFSFIRKSFESYFSQFMQINLIAIISNLIVISLFCKLAFSRSTVVPFFFFSGCFYKFLFFPFKFRVIQTTIEVFSALKASNFLIFTKSTPKIFKTLLFVTRCFCFFVQLLDSDYEGVTVKWSCRLLPIKKGISFRAGFIPTKFR